MGYDIYIQREKASSVGIEARVIGTMEVPNWYVNDEGWEVTLPSKEFPIHGIFVDGKQVECSNIYVTENEIGWRSGPTHEVKDRLKPGDYNESW